MIQLSEDQLKEIADQIQTGLLCFVHKETGELVAFPDLDTYADVDPEGWGEAMEQVEDNPDDYLKISPMTSRDAFRLMEQFTGELPPGPLQRRLFGAISQPKPFQRFKQAIDEAGDYRQHWFAFRDQQTIGWLRQQIERSDDQTNRELGEED